MRQPGAAHAIEPEAALGVTAAIPRVHAPVRELPLQGVGLDDPLRPRLLALLLVFDLDEPPLSDSIRQGRDEISLGVPGARPRRLRQLELPERLFELSAHAVERRVRVGGDHRADELECQADRARLEWCQARGMSESVPVELLVDVYLVALERGVHRVAAAAEVDEIEELQMLLELVLRDVEALDDLVGRDDGVGVLATRGEQVRKQRLQHRETFGHDRPGRPFAEPVLPRRRGGAR